MITRQEIAQLCDYAIGTDYEPLLNDIKSLTIAIEERCETLGNETLLKSFQNDFNNRFFNLFSILFEPISKLEPLPIFGELYYVTEARNYNTNMTRATGMSSCTFIDLVPHTASPDNDKLTDTFIYAVNSKLPVGYNVEFVCNTSDSFPVVCTVNNGLIYIVESCKHNHKKIHLKSLPGYTAQNLPLAILTDKQCAENHAQSFIVGFIDIFNMYYPDCQWKYLTKEFKLLVWNEYCKYITNQPMVSQKYITSQLVEYTTTKHRFSSAPISLFADAQQTLKISYMLTFCQMYTEIQRFPLINKISESVINKNKS